jgi:hypothetical protein
MYGTDATCLPCPIRPATWHFLIGPHVDRKILKMSDTWKPMVLSCHRADVSMTHVILCMFHIHCTNTYVIHTDADINSMDADSSMLIGLG